MSKARNRKSKTESEMWEYEAHGFVVELGVVFEGAAERLHPLLITHRVLLRPEHIDVMRDRHRHLIQSLPQTSG